MNIQFDPFQYTFVTIGGFFLNIFWFFYFHFHALWYTIFGLCMAFYFNWLYSFYNMAYIIKGIEIHVLIYTQKQGWQQQQKQLKLRKTLFYNITYIYLPPNIIKYANSVNDFNIRRRKSTKAYYSLSQLRNEFI